MLVPAQQIAPSSRTAVATKTSLNMVAAEGGFALAALAGCVSGGFFAGGLHAVAGKLNTCVPVPVKMRRLELGWNFHATM
jgi:hypothetical protein